MSGRLVVEGHGTLDVPEGTTLLEACEDAGVPMESDCGGCAGCNACRVRVIAGADALSPRLDEEVPFLDQDDQRLGCQCTVVGGTAHIALDPGL